MRMALLAGVPAGLGLLLLAEPITATVYNYGEFTAFDTRMAAISLTAMSLGIPTVATRVGGTPEIINDNETGILVDSDDLSGFCRAIERLLSDESLEHKMSSAAKRHFETQFTARAMAEQYQRLY
jgi:glycosyltransferase involved in cell wall biosynthesis